MFDAFHIRRQGPFIIISDAARHLLREESCIGPNNGYDGNLDIREDVCWGFEYRHYPEKSNADRKNHEGIRTSQGDNDDTIHCATPSSVEPAKI
jgi:hypothetical protein